MPPQFRVGNRCFMEILGRRFEVACSEDPLDFLPEESEEEGGGITDRTATGEERVQLTGTFDTKRQELIEQTVRTYIGVPTPEQVLDDFEVGFSTYIQGLVQSGTLGQADANLAGDLMPEFLNEFLADLGQRAARGEDIFRVVGIEGEPEFLGTRPGAETTTTTTGEERERGDTTTRTEVESAVGETTEEGEQAETRTREDTTRQEERDITTRTEAEQRFQQEEEIFRQPLLGFVRAVSPAQFLQERYGDAGTLSVALRSRKGERARRAQTAAGGPVVSARRA